MGTEPALLPVPVAVRTLVEPPDHNTGYFAPALSTGQAIEPLEAPAYRAQSQATAVVTTGDAVEASATALAAVLQGLSQKRNAIILYADHLVTDGKNRQIIESIDERASERVGFLNLVFRRRDTLSSPYVEEAARRNACRRILVSNTPTRDAVLCGTIMNLIDAHFGDLDVRRRAEFMLRLEQVIQDATLHWTADRIIEPLSGLEFYPVTKDGVGWRDFAVTQRRYSRDPCKFLVEQFQHYIQFGLLYSGHLRHAHRELYDAVRFSAVHSRGFSSVDAFFAANQILIAADLADPSPPNIRRVKTILAINVALAGQRAVLGHVVTHGKRSRARLIATSPPVPR